MSGLKKTLFVTFTRAALMAAALVPMQAWGQSAGSQNQQQLRDQEADSDREREDRELGGLRGVLDQDQESGGRRRDRNDREGRQGLDGLRDTSIPDADTTRTQDARRQTEGVPNRNISQRDRQPLDQDGVDTVELDQNTEEDPYAALGVRMGSFLLFPEITTDTVYTDNVFQSPVIQEGDWSVELAPSLTVRSDWNRHSLEFTMIALRSYHERFETEEDKTFSAGVTGQFDIRSKTNLVAGANYTESLEERSSNNLPTGTAERPKIRNRYVSLEGNHAFNRVSLTLRGEIAEEAYGESTLINGTVENNSDRDFTESRVTGRVAYEFRPDVAAFIETSVNKREFDEALNRSGRQSSSDGYDIQGGLSFELTGKLTGEVSAGYAIQKPDDALLEDLDGMILNAGLEWKVSGLTTLLFDASSEVDESISTDSAGSLVREAIVSVEHRPRQHIILGASLGYEVETFSGSDQEDKEWALGLTGEYIISRSVALTVGYDYEKNIEDDSADNYSVNEVRFGVRVRR